MQRARRVVGLTLIFIISVASLHTALGSCVWLLFSCTWWWRLGAQAGLAANLLS